MKNIILCADDFAINAETSRGLLDLIRRERLSAVSCMTNYPDWKTSGIALKEHTQKIQLGIHFNFGNTPMPLTLLRAYLRSLSTQKISDEITRQITLFFDVMGKLPDFIDGHEHIHQFPVIRDALITVYEKIFLQKTTYIRSTCNQQPEFKARIIQTLGGNALRKLLNLHKIPHNTSFAGIYNFNQAKNYRTYFLKFLDTVEDGGILMCHPGFSENPENSRQLEYQYFASATFLEDLQTKNFSLTRS